MPLTEKGDKIKDAMAKQYGEKKGEQVFYASKNAGKISGVDEGEEHHEGGGGGKEDFVKSFAGPMAAMALSDEDVGEVAKRFDEMRDNIHKLDKRLDDCGGAMDALKPPEGQEPPPEGQ